MLRLICKQWYTFTLLLSFTTLAKCVFCGELSDILLTTLKIAIRSLILKSPLNPGMPAPIRSFIPSARTPNYVTGKTEDCFFLLSEMSNHNARVCSYA